MLPIFFFLPGIFSILYLLLYGLPAFAARSLKEHLVFQIPRGLFNLQKRFAYIAIAESQKWQPIAWRIPGTEEPGGLPSVGSHRVRHD